MNAHWIETIAPNLTAWCLQIALVSVAGAGLPFVFRMKAARARLWFWQAILAACVALPVLQPWLKPAPLVSNITFTTGAFRIAETQQPAAWHISWPVVALVALTAGIALRLLWLGIGILRLRIYRDTALPLDSSADLDDLRRDLAPEAEILLSAQVSSPVTFGVWNPVVLLPERFRNLDLEHRRSIVCHEFIHIQRRDWAVAIAEELVRTILWFHPAIWWLLGRIQLSREQVVDQAVIEHTGDRRRYLDALLAIASFRLRADLAPAPLFLKKRHLRQRVESILSGVHMTKRNLLLPLAAAFATLPVFIGIAAWQFPLHAAPQEAVDDSGIEVQPAPVQVLHRSSIQFPDDAHARQLSGTVVANVTVDDKGEVTGAHAVSGPDELRKAVVQSILNWHFAMEATSPHSFDVAVRFNGGQAPPQSTRPQESVMLPGNADDTPRTVDTVNLGTLPAVLRDRITQAGIVHVGDSMTRDSFKNLEASLRNIDEHLRVTAAMQGDKVHVMVHLSNGQPWRYSVGTPTAARKTGVATASITPTPAAAGQTADSASTSQNPIRVGGMVQASNLLSQVRPAYPPMAKQARIQGTVRFNALIGADGFVKNLAVTSGHPMLVAAAMDAVKQWIYKPTLLNGNPVEVITTIDINFTLNDTPPATAAQPQ